MIQLWIKSHKPGNYTISFVWVILSCRAPSGLDTLAEDIEEQGGSATAEGVGQLACRCRIPLPLLALEAHKCVACTCHSTLAALKLRPSTLAPQGGVLQKGVSRRWSIPVTAWASIWT